MKISGFNQRLFEGREFVPIPKTLDTLQKKYGIRQITFFKVSIGVVAIVFFAALLHLQVIQGAYYRNLAEQNRIRTKEIKPVRGIIYDRNGIPLVKNEPHFTLLVVPYDLRQSNVTPETLITRLREYYLNQESFDELMTPLTTYSYLPVILKKNLSYEEGIRLIPLIEQWPGTFLQETFKREYRNGELFSHILGYTSSVSETDLATDDFYSLSDITGRAGIEMYYEKTLRGIKGTEALQVTSLGKEDKTLHYTPSQKGDDLLLTIDQSMQGALTDILKTRMQEFNVDRAAAIALDPQNGEILALVSLPSFDNNLFTTQFDQETYDALIDNPDNPLFPRAISGEYPPGSTFKLIVGAAALEEKIVTPTTTITSTGGINVGPWFFPDWRAGGHGTVDIRGAIAWSVNTYFYSVGGGYESIDGLGIARINRYAQKFHLGMPLGIDLPGEASGFLPTKEWKLEKKEEKWYLGDTYHASIGQGDVLVTPLQLALFTSVFANGGVLYKPHVVIGEPEIIDKDFISRHNINVIKQGLRDTVRFGSAQSLESLGITAAGKTGSAQFSQTKKPHGWFTGFAPYDNPHILITVLMEEGDGAKSAVPVARDFFKWIQNYSPLRVKRN